MRSSRLIIFLFFFALVSAQNVNESALNLASEHPAFASLLAARDGWTGAAYNSHNPYGIWRVQFWDAEQQDLGWLDLNPETNTVFAWEYHTDLTDLERENALNPIFDFLKNHNDIQKLVGELNKDNLRVNFHNGQRNWHVRIEQGRDTFLTILQSKQGNLRSTEQLELKNVFFQNIPSYDEWASGHEASIVALAFAKADIAAALRGRTNWTSTVSALQEGLWLVEFYEAEQLLASAQVDLNAATVAQFEVKNP